MGVSRHGIRATSLINVASGKDEGNGYPDLPVPGQRVGRKEGWEVWVEDEADREGILKVMSRSSQSIKDESSSMWKKSTRTTARKQKKDACPQWTQTTARVPGPRKRRTSWKGAHRQHLKDYVCRMLQTPIRQDHRDMCWKMKLLKPRITSAVLSSARKMFPVEPVLEGPLWEAPYG